LAIIAINIILNEKKSNAHALPLITMSQAFEKREGRQGDQIIKKWRPREIKVYVFDWQRYQSIFFIIASRLRTVILNVNEKKQHDVE
jgi:hypothetical protein